MTTFMLAQLQLKYGADHLARYNEAMVTVRELFETEGVMLRHGMVTRVGRLYQAWNLWEIDDQGHIARALAKLASHPKAPSTIKMLADVVEHEDVHFLESLPFSSNDAASSRTSHSRCSALFFSRHAALQPGLIVL